MRNTIHIEEIYIYLIVKKRIWNQLEYKHDYLRLTWSALVNHCLEHLDTFIVIL